MFLKLLTGQNLCILPLCVNLRLLSFCAFKSMSQIKNDNGTSQTDSSIIAQKDSGSIQTSVNTDVDIDKRLKDWEDAIDDKALTSSENAIHRLHLIAVRSRQETYIDPSTGYTVISIFGHLMRGHCCGRACRHCPFHHANAPPNERQKMCYNSAFYVK